MHGLALQVQQGLKRDPNAGDLYIFRGRTGSLVKILWHDGLGTARYAKRLDRGRFTWPSATDGGAATSAAQMACRPGGSDAGGPQAAGGARGAGRGVGGLVGRLRCSGP